MMPTRVMLADDQVLVRSGFRMMIDAADDMAVVAEAANGADALDLAVRLRPDVCLLDIRMPGLDGLGVLRRLQQLKVIDPPAVVMVTTFDLDEYVDDALRHGACGFLLKDSGPDLLLEAVRAAATGEAIVSPRITTRLVRHYLQRRPSRPQPASSRLSQREEEVARAVARGWTNSEIADDTHMAVSTVKTHLAAVQRKIAARNRVEVAIWVHEELDPNRPPPPKGLPRDV